MMNNEFPDPDEEFDLIHEDEYEALRDIEAESAKKSQSTKSQELRTGQSESRGKPKIVSDVILSSEFRKPINKRADDEPNELNRNDTSSVHLIGTKNDYSDRNTKKRNYEELFGDITDLLGTDFDEIRKPKEKRARWTHPDEVILKVLEARHTHHARSSELAKKRKSHEDTKKVDSISLRVPPWNFIALTRPYDSQRVYVRVKGEKIDISKKMRTVSNLLLTPYEKLKAEAEEIMIKKVERESLRATDTSPNTDRVEDELWVDKYRPKSYIELLSDENVNRHFLHWLKLWDKVVFNKDTMQTRKKKHTVSFGNKKFEDTEPAEELDSKGYPIHRIVLLTGPPGLGKTTLAHLAAKHAGYNVVEINASDERGPDAFRQILLASTQMRAVMGDNPRPNCLILDEIDGAPASSIELLLKFVQGKLVPKGKKKAKTEKESDGCQRPVICICNELYVPSLRPLRAVALTIPVPEVSPSRLADRLMEIAKKEKLNVNPGVLLKLAETTGCDVRSCLGALQYMGSANLKDNLSSGLKDSRKGLFDSWREIFTIPMSASSTVSSSERANRILKIVQGGDTERLAQGTFHNYPEICGENLQHVAMSLDWFQFFDEVLSLVMSHQVWSVMPYTNYAFVAWHLCLARTQAPKVFYPFNLTEMNRKLGESLAIITITRRASGHDYLAIVMDFAPFLPDLLSPRLRTISGHLLSFKEKADLAHLVNVMLDFGLTLAQEKNPDGTYEYKLDPNIFAIGIFPDCKVHRSMTYPVKQMVARELEVEQLKRAANVTGLTGKDTKNESPRTSANVDSTKGKEQNEPQNASSTMTTLSNQLTKVGPQPKELVYKDFFGRIITADQHQKGRGQKQLPDKTSPESSKTQVRVRDILIKHGVGYKYKEGCSNAVRRTVLMEELI